MKCLGLNELDFTKWIEKPVSARISKSSCTQGKKGFTQVDSLDEQTNTIQKWATNYKQMSQ